MEDLSDLDKLRFYRDEVKHEFALLAMRSTMLVTCQSFLIVPFGIMNSAASFAWVVVPLCMVAILGMFVALVLRGPLDAADRTIDKWLQKQRQLLKDRPALQDLALDRDLIDGAHSDSSHDLEHARSLQFSRRAPWAFVTFWMVALVWILVRALFGPP